jgi:hypothetical protein
VTKPNKAMSIWDPVPVHQGAATARFLMHFTSVPSGHKILLMGITSQTTRALTVQLLEWIQSKPRTYADTLDAWRTSCPRLSIWEDACIEGLVEIAPGGRIVAVSAKGRLLLEHS